MRIPFVLVLCLAVAAPLLPGTALATGDVDVHGLKPTERRTIGDRLEPGSNSFTEAQVREKFAEMGFGEVTDLAKDEQGIWHGKAMHAGKRLSIRMDYRGNVAAE